MKPWPGRGPITLAQLDELRGASTKAREQYQYQKAGSPMGASLTLDAVFGPHPLLYVARAARQIADKAVIQWIKQDCKRAVVRVRSRQDRVRRRRR